MLLLSLLLATLLLDGGEVLGVALGHEILDVAGQTVHQGLNLALLGLHGTELLGLLLLEGLEVGLLLLKPGLLLLELLADLLDFLDDLLVGVVDLLDIPAVGQQLVEGLRSEQQLEDAAGTLFVAVRYAAGEDLLLGLELLLLFLDGELRLVDLALDVFDLGDRLLLLERQRLELRGERIELGLDGSELFLGGCEGVERCLGGAGGVGVAREAKQHGGAGGRQHGLNGASAGELFLISKGIHSVFDALFLLVCSAGRDAILRHRCSVWVVFVCHMSSIKDTAKLALPSNLHEVIQMKTDERWARRPEAAVGT